jgi:tRNA (guanine26-N2/guanine27-N2)-dimethyltransferase
VRRYKAKPLHNYLMHEVGVRILAKYVIETGLKYGLLLKPVFSQSTRHYMRVYFKAVKNFQPTKQIKKWKNAGPMWLGSLWDADLIEKMHGISLKDSNISAETRQLLFTMKNEASINVVGFYDLSELQLRQVPKLFDVISKLQEKGYSAARTHFSPTGIKTNAKEKEFKNILRSLG